MRSGIGVVGVLGALLTLSAPIFAGTGYVYVGDLNQDGIADRIESGPTEFFGNAGGPFLITLSKGDTDFESFILGLHPFAVRAELLDTGKVRLWSYWRMGGRFGSLCTTDLSGIEPSTDCLRIYTGSDATDVGRGVYDSVFDAYKRLVFTEVQNYIAPPHPCGFDWGKGYGAQC